MARRRTVVVGDSLGVGTVPYLQRALGGPVRADVRVGRSSSDGVNALSRLLRGGADRVVLDLGTNDGSAQQLRQSVRRAQSLAGSRPIYIPTVNGPGAAEKNAMLRRLAGGNVHLVDWAGQSRGLVGGDGIHASGRGYQERARIVAHSISRADAASSPATTGGTMFRDIRLRRQDPSPLLAQIISGGGLQDAGGVAGQLQEGMGAHPGHLASVLQNHAQPTGSLATLGRGLSTGGPGGAAPQDFTRRVVRRGNRLLEEHDYGPGTEAKFFERKSPAVLAAAVRQSPGPRPNTLRTGAMLRGVQGTQADLSARDEELLKLLLGNPTLRR